MENMEAIVPLLGKSEDFREWNAATGMDWETYQRITGRVEEAIYWSSVFVPEFVELNGMVLRRRQYPMVSTEDSPFLPAPTKTQSEYLVNHLHIRELFFNDPLQKEYDDKVYSYIANYIVGSWRRILRELFPEKEFEVELNDNHGDIEVYFVTKRD